MPTTLLDKLPGYLLRRAAQAATAELAQRLAAIDLRITDASALLLIGDRTDLTSSKLGKMLDIQRANMVPLLNRVEAAGLIVRRPIDGKRQAIVLTEAGQAKRTAVELLTCKFEEDLLAKIPSAHREHLVPALKTILTW